MPWARSILVLAVVAALAAGSGCRTDGRIPVIVYSPHGQAQLQAFEERFEQAYPQYDLEPVDLPSQNIPDRLRAERANPQADVWWGASAATFEQAADENLLEPYTPPWSDQIPADAKDPENRWYGIYETPEVIVYNPEIVAPADVPADWDDLLDPKWRGRILVRDPGPSDTIRTIFGSIILRHWNEQNGPDGGYAWLRRLDANTKDYPASWDAVLTSLNRHEAAVTVWNMPDVKRVVLERGYSLEIVYPASGSPVVTDGIAIIRGAPHSEGARALYEFINTPDSLAFAAAKFYRIPTRRDIDRSTLPEWMRALDFKRMPMDWTVYRKNIREWMRVWNDQIRGASSQ